MGVFFDLYVFQLRHCNALGGDAPLDVLLVPHTDLIMCPREAPSPVGKRGNPRGGRVTVM